MGWFPGNNSFDLAEGSLIVFSMELGKLGYCHNNTEYIYKCVE